MLNKQEMIKLEEIFKIYENDKEMKLKSTEPFIVRIRQQSYKEFCKNFKKPYDSIYSNIMIETMRRLCKELPGCTLGFYGHNEINLVFTFTKGRGELAYLKGSKTISYISSVVASNVVNIFNDVLQDEIRQQEYKNESRLEEHKIDVDIYRSKIFKSIFTVNSFNLPKEKLFDYILLKHAFVRRDAIVYAASIFMNKNDANSKSCDELVRILKEQYNYDFENNSVISARFKNGTLCNKVTESKNTSSILIDITKPLSNKNRKDIERMMITNNMSGCVKPQYII